MNLIEVGKHFINLDNVCYSIRDGKKVVVFFACAGETNTAREPYYLDLLDAEADDFERKLQGLCN